MDQAGKPIVGARVLVLNTKDNTTRTLTTDVAGNYAIQGLTAGCGLRSPSRFPRCCLRTEVHLRPAGPRRQPRELPAQPRCRRRRLAAGDGNRRSRSGVPDLRPRQTESVVRDAAGCSSADPGRACCCMDIGENRKVWEEFPKATPGTRMGRHVAGPARTRRQPDQEPTAASGEPGLENESAGIPSGYRSRTGLAQEAAAAEFQQDRGCRIRRRSESCPDFERQVQGSANHRGRQSRA